MSRRRCKRARQQRQQGQQQGSNGKQLKARERLAKIPLEIEQLERKRASARDPRVIHEAGIEIWNRRVDELVLSRFARGEGGFSWGYFIWPAAEVAGHSPYDPVTKE